MRRAHGAVKVSSCQMSCKARAAAPQKHHEQLASPSRSVSHIPRQHRDTPPSTTACVQCTPAFQHGAPRRLDPSLASTALVERPDQNITAINTPTQAIWTHLVFFIWVILLGGVSSLILLTQTPHVAAGAGSF